MLFAGVAELLIAGALIWLTLRIPGSDSIERGFRKAETLTGQTRDQLGILRDQATILKASPMLADSRQLAANTRSVAVLLETQRIDFESVRAIAQAIDRVRESVDPANAPFSPEKLRQLAVGMSASADFLEKNLADGSARSADQIAVALAGLETSSKTLAGLLQTAAPDLSAVRDVYDGLERFDTGLGQLGELFDVKKIATVREGLGGIETTLRSTAASADRISGFRYPHMQVKGLRPEIEMKPFWAEGDEIAEGLRKAATGSAAATERMVALEKSLPTLLGSLDASRVSIRRTRDALGKTLANRKEIEAAMVSAPKQAAQFAEALPKAGKELVALMRETGRLREVAKTLRAFGSQLDATADRWPEVRRMMEATSGVLAKTRERFDGVLARQKEYQNALLGSVTLAKTFADQLPEFVDRVELGLTQQEASLERMQSAIADVGDELPQARQTALELLMGVRVLAWLIVGLTLLHALHSLRGR